MFWWGLIAAGSVAFDWRIFVEAGQRAWAGSPDLYEVNALYSFRHSPVFAYLMPAIAWIGTDGIRIVTLGAALALPTWGARLLALLSWPLAMDVQHGALTMPMVLLAAWGLRGSRFGSVGFILFTLLSPRPLMVPVAAYLLWRQPWLRLPALALAAANVAVVLASGYADDWIGMLTSVGTVPTAAPLNLSPSRFLGTWWIPIGFVLALLLTLRGRIGLGALAISPYVLPHYLLFALLDLGRADQRAKDATDAIAAAQTAR